jgi:tol-pal system protein YbgF
MFRRFTLAPLALAIALFVLPAAAQQRMSTGDRLTALEQQLAASRSGNVDLLNQIAALRNETQALRAQLEEAQQQLQQQQQSARSQYLDIDGRLNRLESGALPASPAVAPTATAPTATAPTAATPRTPAPTATSPRPAQTASTVASPQDSAPRVYGDPSTLAKGADERGNYNIAFDALKAGRYADAARLFQDFLDVYPNGAFAPNAYYWLGESYYVTQNYALAEEQFRVLLERFPTHDKAPGSLLKIGLSQYGLRQLDAAEATLAQVLARYPGSEAARTADDRLRAIQLSRVR